MILAPVNGMRKQFTKTILACLATFIAACCLQISVPCIHAQSPNTGAVSGNVTDPSGAAVADATIKLTNAATGDVRTVHSQSNGLYVAPLLLPGVYTVEATKQGFKTLVLTGIHVYVTETAALNVRARKSEKSLRPSP